ncbi:MULTISPECIES: efflux RND transporter periplasmic adaptor subunit [Legionella]|uniref:efflux RND transporter periplasmic adaptor subunit n=1 Tax=Legionella TaxID=445 RepID=UPI000F8DA549|nr:MULTISPECIES: efflux RND transporter periplasmic adaptor subunit [Legionella]MCP0913027.1 efflux RND transporter periplasmic adaptor subunit [Legionella sp. 27cVA30]RUQ98536.1 efflux RND transporter periplasmic adaptor subunit [Legionella septentrionalis]RUR10959.1 efflux RND transporter periplasmic adaptor subunit [Legionella septentrionalis]RUR15393.1 efflux RND transporter periplasmic adaptor subunit [Legionella septentrionalis]
MKKRMTIMLIGLLVVFGGIIGFNLFKGFMIKRFFASYEPPAVTVSSVKAQKRDWQPHIAAVGNFVAINGVEVNSQASGNVVAIHFDSGQFIEKDKPLIDIDDSVDQATLKFNQSELALQDINYKRQADLFKRGATSTSSLDEAKAKMLQAQANVEKTEATIRQKHIRAPFSGQLGIRQVNLGQFISPGQTSIVTLQSLDPLFLEFYLPEQLLKKLHLNQAVTFSVEQNPGILFTGKITAINAKVDINTHNILVQATIPNCPAKALKDPLHSTLIKAKKEKQGNRIIVACDSELNTKNKIHEFNFIPGMFADIEVEQPSIPNVVVLPTTAISFSLYGNSVFLIEKDGKKDKEGKDILVVKRAFVSTGEQEGNFTMIKKGVSAGQEVVSVGEIKLQDGTRVVINNDIQLNETVDPDDLGQ